MDSLPKSPVSDDLKKIFLKVVDHKSCHKKYLDFEMNISPLAICAYRKHGVGICSVCKIFFH